MLKLVLLSALLLAAPAEAGLFGSVEYRRDAGAPLDTWRAMAARQTRDGCAPVEVAMRPFDDVAPAGYAPLRQISGCGRVALDAARLVARLARQPLVARLATVNAAINLIPYVEDRANYGVDDYWAGLDEFLGRGGDCEDYAIAKYMLLRRTGVPASAMRVVVVRDMALATSHAVLAVTVGDETDILDNQTAEVKPASAVARYRPVYSINETGWWLHMPQN